VPWRPYNSSGGKRRCRKTGRRSGRLVIAGRGGQVLIKQVAENPSLGKIRPPVEESGSGRRGLRGPEEAREALFAVERGRKGFWSVSRENRLRQRGWERGKKESGFRFW